MSRMIKTTPNVAQIKMKKQSARFRAGFLFKFEQAYMCYAFFLCLIIVFFPYLYYFRFYFYHCFAAVLFLNKYVSRYEVRGR